MEAQALPRTGRLFLPRSPKVLAALSDEKLVEQVRRGNEAAFEVVYDRHHRGILSFCRHMLGSADEAEDAVQQTFISAYSALEADRRDIRLKAWLYTIARNRCLSILRARREQPAELDELPVAGLTDEVQHRADLRELLADLHGLPIDQRSALVLSEVGDLTHAEVGAIIGCEVAKVKSLVFQARSSLIETRKAREIPCEEIREQLATATGGVLRRGPLRRHIRACPGCAEFRDDVMRQRKALAAILPVVPSLGLKKAALSALGIGGGGGGAAIGGGGLGGGIVSALSSGAAVKFTGAAVLAGIAVGGGIVINQDGKAPAAQAAAGQSNGGQAWPAPPAGAGPGAQSIAQHRVVARPAAKAPALTRHHAAKAPAAPAAKAHARHRAAPSVSHGRQQRHTGTPASGHHHGSHGGGRHMTAPTAAPTPAPAAPTVPTSAPSHGHDQSGSHGHSDHSGPPPYGSALGYDGHPGQSEHSDGAGHSHDGAGSGGNGTSGSAGDGHQHSHNG